MHTLKELIDEILADAHDEFSYRDLQSCDQHRLAAAYIRENNDIIFDIFADVHVTCLAHHFAKLTSSVDDCDVFDMATDIRHAIIGASAVDSLIDTEIKLQRRQNERYQSVEAA